jgi:hypothetical protein
MLSRVPADYHCFDIIDVSDDYVNWIIEGLAPPKLLNNEPFDDQCFVDIDFFLLIFCSLL